VTHADSGKREKNDYTVEYAFHWLILYNYVVTEMQVHWLTLLTNIIMCKLQQTSRSALGDCRRNRCSYAWTL